MKNNHKTTSNDSDKPQWWQRFSRFLRRHQPQLKCPGSDHFQFQHSELVIRHFPLSFGKNASASQS